MGIHDFIKQYEKQIMYSATSEQVEEELLARLEEIEDYLIDLERDIEEEQDKKDTYEYPSDDVLADEFNYTCRALGV